MKMKSAVLSLILLICLSFGQLAGAESHFLPQSQHNRMLFFEYWRGSYFEGSYNDYDRKIRLEYCGVENDHTCRLLVPLIPIELADQYNEPLLKALKAFRNKLARDSDKSIFALFTGGSKKNSNVAAMDKLILDLQEVGFGHWVFLSEENLTLDPPEFSSPAIADGLFELIRNVLTTAQP
jgi:hypothetical protein